MGRPAVPLGAVINPNLRTILESCQIQRGSLWWDRVKCAQDDFLFKPGLKGFVLHILMSLCYQTCSTVHVAFTGNKSGGCKKHLLEAGSKSSSSKTWNWCQKKKSAHGTLTSQAQQVSSMSDMSSAVTKRNRSKWTLPRLFSECSYYFSHSGVVEAPQLFTLDEAVKSFLKGVRCGLMSQWRSPLTVFLRRAAEDLGNFSVGKHCCWN